MPVRNPVAEFSYRLTVPTVPSDLKISLTESEKRLLTAVARFGQTRTVAATLGLSQHTVKNRLNTIYRKLRVASRTGAILRAVQLGLIDI